MTSTATQVTNFVNTDHDDSLSERKIRSFFPQLVAYAEEVEEAIVVTCRYMSSSSTGSTPLDCYTIKIGQRSLSFVTHHWDSCCAQAILARLGVSYHAYRDARFMELMADELKDFLRNQLDVPMLVFALSEEEVTNQYETASILGFVDTIEPYLSYKTGNTIHMMALDLQNECDIEQARDEHETNLDHDDWYSGNEDDEDDF